MDKHYKRTVFSWSMYDFANQPFTTLIVTFIYSTYFVQAIAPDEITGTVLWSRGITVTALFVAFFSPLMGAIADQGGYRKASLIFWTWIKGQIGNFNLETQILLSWKLVLEWETFLLKWQPKNLPVILSE